MKHTVPQAPAQGSDTISSTLLRTCVQPKWSSPASKGINEVPLIIDRLFPNLFPTSSSLQNCYFNLKWSRNEPIEWTSRTQVIRPWVWQQLFADVQWTPVNRHSAVWMLLLTASSAEAAAACVSTLNPTQLRNLHLPHSAAGQAKAGNYTEPSSNKCTTLNRVFCLKLLHLDPLKHTHLQVLLFSHIKRNCALFYSSWQL